MGYGLRLDTLWVPRNAHKLDIEAGLAVIRQALKNETDIEQIRRAYDYALDTTIQDLPLDVLFNLREDGDVNDTYEAILEGYRKHILHLEDSLQNRDVTELWIGDLIGYVTGGISFGERSETGELWFNLVVEDEDPEGCANPYADILYDAMFVHPGDFVRDKIAEAVAIKDIQLAKISTIVEDESWGEIDILETRRSLLEVLHG